MRLKPSQATSSTLDALRRFEGVRDNFASWVHSGLRQFCQDRLDGARAVTQRGFQMNGSRARDITFQVWKRKVAPMVGSPAITLVHMLARLASVCRTRAEACAIALGSWRKQTGALLPEAAKVGGLPPKRQACGI